MAKKFYAVRKGCETGIFDSWDEACKSVDGYSCASYKGFNSYKEAENFLKGNEKSKYFYAVAVGRNPGIYDTWEKAQEQVNGYSKALYRKFKDKTEDKKFINKWNKI